MDPVRWKASRLGNVVRSALLLLAMAGLLGLLGWLLAGELGILVAVLGTVVLCAVSPALAPRVVLRIAGGRRLAYRAAPQLHDTLALLAERAALERVPALYYVPSRAVNAFAVGDASSSAVAVSDGILRVLSPRELAGVLAHEVSHLHNGDVWLMALSGVFARVTRALSLAGQLLVVLNVPLVLLGEVSMSWSAITLLVFAPLVSLLLQLALSRTREFDADLGAVALTGDPRGLAAALDKLARLENGWLARLWRTAGQRPSALWLRSHPATAERVRRLLALTPDLPMATAGWTSRGDLPGPVSGAGRIGADPHRSVARRRR